MTTMSTGDRGSLQMVGFVFDLANATTLAGLLAGGGALMFAIEGRFHPALATSSCPMLQLRECSRATASSFSRASFSLARL